jgi:tRNA modification GTPase
VPEDLIGPALHAAQQLRSEIAAILADGRRGERLREGLVVAIAGPPNAGKSKLFNRLARREAAIVSPYAGTTRDVIEVHLDLEGYPVTLLDTAGLRDSNEPIEQEGMRRARDRAASADVVLWVVDVAAIEEASEHALGQGVSEVWLIKNKIDLIAKGDASGGAKTDNSEYKFTYLVSAEQDHGIQELVSGLGGYAQSFFAAAESGIVTRARHRRALEETVAALDRALAEGKKTGGREELIAEELRAAATVLGRLTGRVDVEDILDVIFRDFCIGK